METTAPVVVPGGGLLELLGSGPGFGEPDGDGTPDDDRPPTCGEPWPPGTLAPLGGDAGDDANPQPATARAAPMTAPTATLDRHVQGLRTTLP